MIQEDEDLPQATKPPFLSALHAKNDTTNPFGYKLGESTENNKGNNSDFLCCWMQSDKLVNCHV